MVYVFRRSDCKISFFFSKYTKHSTFNSKDGYVLVLSRYHIITKTCHIYTADLSQNHENPKPVTLSFPTSYGYRSVLAKLII